MSNALDGRERNSFENEFNFFLEVIAFSYRTLLDNRSIFILVYIFRTDVIPRGEALEKKRTRFF